MTPPDADTAPELLLLPCDCIIAILTRLEPVPPAQAMQLARLSATCRALRRLAKLAAVLFIHTHLGAAQRELTRLHAALGEEAEGGDDEEVCSLTLGLDGDGDNSLGAPQNLLFALWSQMPLLPLRCELLHNCVTRLDDADAAAVRACAHATGIRTVRTDGAPLSLRSARDRHVGDVYPQHPLTRRRRQTPRRVAP